MAAKIHKGPFTVEGQLTAEGHTVWHEGNLSASAISGAQSAATSAQQALTDVNSAISAAQAAGNVGLLYVTSHTIYVNGPNDVLQGAAGLETALGQMQAYSAPPGGLVIRVQGTITLDRNINISHPTPLALSITGSVNTTPALTAWSATDAAANQTLAEANWPSRIVTGSYKLTVLFGYYIQGLQYIAFIGNGGSTNNTAVEVRGHVEQLNYCCFSEYAYGLYYDGGSGRNSNTNHYIRASIRLLNAKVYSLYQLKHRYTKNAWLAAVRVSTSIVDNVSQFDIINDYYGFQLVAAHMPYLASGNLYTERDGISLTRSFMKVYNTTFQQDSGNIITGVDHSYIYLNGNTVDLASLRNTTYLARNSIGQEYSTSGQAWVHAPAKGPTGGSYGSFWQ